MRNPGLRFVGITSGPVGVGVFGNRAEEELRLWLESRLDALGIDPVAYTRCVLSLLRRPDSALSPGPDLPGTKSRTQGKNNKQQQRTKTKLSQQSEREHKRAVVQCLTNASDQTCYGVESLVDELCAKLRDLEGSNNNNNNNNNTDDNQIDCHSIEKKNKTDTSNNIETLTSRDKVLRYYAAFPALQPSTPKKVTQKKTNNNNNNKIINNNNNNISNLKKYRNIGINGKNNNKNSNDKHNNSNNNNNNNNININNNNNNNNNHKGRQAKKTKMSIQVIDTRKIEEKETFGFAKSLEREREKELDDLRLAQLQAKFDESLEALWDSGPGNSSDKSSIWAAPSLSIPSGPHWPINTDELPLILPTKTPYNDYIIDDPQIIPWNIDLIGIGKNDKKLNYNFNWSNNIDNDAPWSLKDIGNNLINMEKGLKTTGCFIPIPPNNKSLVDKKKLIVNEDKCKVNDKINDYHDNDSDEDLLTSNKTHFRPIKDDGNWADGTTFPVNNHFERVAYRRSNSKNLLYLPGGESPYMEYKDNTTTTSTSSSSSSSSSNGNNFTLKFRVRQCDKSIQTDPIRSPVKRRIINEKNNFYYPSINDILNNDMDDDDVDEHDEDDKDASFTIGPLGWIKPSVGLISDRKRRHSSSFKCRPLAALRPLTL